MTTVSDPSTNKFKGTALRVPPIPAHIFLVQPRGELLGAIQTLNTSFDPILQALLLVGGFISTLQNGQDNGEH